MKGIDFLDALGELDEAYIEEADMKKAKIIPWKNKKLLSYAASILVVCTLSIVGYQSIIGSEDSLNVAEVEVDGLERSVEPAVISEDTLLDDQPAAVGEEPLLEETTTETEEKNMFEKIFENIVSFFQGLRF